jgi:RecA-family ATPase
VIHPLKTAADIEALSQKWNSAAAESFAVSPTVLSVAEILALDVPEPGMLIEGMVPMRGASLVVGAAKSGKTLLAAQVAIAVASRTALFQNYRVLQPGAVMLIEQDDPAATASMKQILQRSSCRRPGFHFIWCPKSHTASGRN